MLEVIKEDRIKQLESLLEILAEAIDEKPGARDLSQLSKQYRETLAEIEELKGSSNEEGDLIGEILQKRSDTGQSRAVRKDRTKI